MGIMSKEEFEDNLRGRDISIIVNNVLLDLRSYSGQQIHSLPELELTLGHIQNWVRKGWLKNQGIDSFEQLKEKDNGTYCSIVEDLYDGLSKGLFKI